jgi:hypothetical protein
VLSSTTISPFIGGRTTVIDINDDTYYWNLTFTYNKKSEIKFDPELLFDYCEICEVKCDPELPHQCISRIHKKDSQQRHFHILSKGLTEKKRKMRKERQND